MPRPLFQKLGLKEGMNVLLIAAPENYQELVSGVDYSALAYDSSLKADFIHLFSKNKQQLLEGILAGIQMMHSKSIFWISWPKQRGNVHSEINREKVREYGLIEGLVDIKVASIDVNWSGLKFVIPLKDR